MSPRCRSCTPVPTELRAAAGLLERRWTMATIYACSSGAARFNEFRQSLPGVSPTTLSDRLEQLEAAGIVERTLVAGRPPHTEYTLTRARPAAGRGRRRPARAPLERSRLAQTGGRLGRTEALPAAAGRRAAGRRRRLAGPPGAAGAAPSISRSRK